MKAKSRIELGLNPGFYFLLQRPDLAIQAAVNGPGSEGEARDEELTRKRGSSPYSQNLFCCNNFLD
ncbi:hypothetical protein SDJN02_15599, partial [Cucurbita argyrosperma subsp. argyrosperma]